MRRRTVSSGSDGHHFQRLGNGGRAAALDEVVGRVGSNLRVRVARQRTQRIDDRRFSRLSERADQASTFGWIGRGRKQATDRGEAGRTAL